LINPLQTPTNHTNKFPQLTALIVNCQSLVAKRASFLNLLDLHLPDVVLGSESWLNSGISNNEMFPLKYVVYCRDRDDGYGGIFLACCNTLATHEVNLSDANCEVVACQIQFKNHPSLIVCSVYCPPSSDELYLRSLCQ